MVRVLWMVSVDIRMRSLCWNEGLSLMDNGLCFVIVLMEMVLHRIHLRSLCDIYICVWCMYYGLSDETSLSFREKM